MKSDLDRFLRLSKNTLLDLNLHFRGTLSGVDGNPSSSLSPRLLEELGRIRRIVIHVSGQDVKVLQLMNAMDISSRLTSLTFSRAWVGGAAGRQNLIQKDRKTICLPRLLDLTLSGAMSDKLPYLSLPVLKHLRVYDGSLEFEWIHTLVCSASQSLNKVLFKRVKVQSVPPAHLIAPAVNLQSLTSFDLELPNLVMTKFVGEDLPFIEYQTFLIQHVTSPFKLGFQGAPLPFFELAHSLFAVSLKLKLIVVTDTPRDEEQTASMGNGEIIRRFLKGFPELRKLRASLGRFTGRSYEHTVLGDRSLLCRVFQDLTNS